MANRRQHYVVDPMTNELVAMPLNTGNPAALGALVNGDIENFLVAATPGGIERQEKDGQTALVASTNMPLDLRPNREAYEKLGFTFGDKIDEVFQHATLPKGWTRKATDHSMWSRILDDKGRERVAVFYKAAFYDRHADARLEARYKIETMYHDSEGFTHLEKDENCIVVTDGGKAIYQEFATKRDDWKQSDEHRTSAERWLLEHYPDARDPTAYWD